MKKEIIINRKKIEKKINIKNRIINKKNKIRKIK